MVAAHRKKPLVSDEGLAQLSRCIPLLRGRRSQLYLPAPQPQAAPLPPSPNASAARTAWPGLLSAAGPAKEKEEVLVRSGRMKTVHGRKPQSKHKSLPICQILKQSLNFAAGTYLGADLQDVLLHSAWAGQAPLLNYSQEVLLLLICICKLSSLANTDKKRGGKAKSI